MSAAVVDASVAIKWVVDEPGSRQAAALLERPLLAPDLIYAECCNVLWRKARRFEITTDFAQRAAEELMRSDLILVRLEDLALNALHLALRLDHPIYDCFYLALALDRGVPLATADRRLMSKVSSAYPEIEIELIA